MPFAVSAAEFLVVPDQNLSNALQSEVAEQYCSLQHEIVGTVTRRAQLPDRQRHEQQLSRSK